MAVKRPPPALRPGDRVAVVAPASPCAEDAVGRGILELESQGFEVVRGSAHLRAGGRLPCRRAGASRRAPAGGVCQSVHPRHRVRARRLRQRPDPASSGRGGDSRDAEGLRRLQRHHGAAHLPEQRCGLVSFHGPMLEGRFADRARYDCGSFVRAVSVSEPMGALVPASLEIWRDGRGLRRARRRDHDAARVVARYPVGVRSAARVRAVLRRGERAPVPAGLPADAARAGRDRRSRQRHRLQRTTRLRRAREPRSRCRRGPPCAGRVPGSHRSPAFRRDTRRARR